MASFYSTEISSAGRSFANFYSLMGSVNSARGNIVENRRQESYLSPPGLPRGITPFQEINGVACNTVTRKEAVLLKYLKI